MQFLAISHLQFYVLVYRMTEKAHYRKLVHGIEKSVVSFAVAVIFRKNAQH